MHATVRDSDDGTEFTCVILDASKSGCRVVCNRLDELPDAIMIHPQGLDRPIRARIAWRCHRIAGVHFLWDGQDPAPFATERASGEDNDGP